MPEPLASAARELYGLPLEEFTPARNARAKEAKASGDRELAEQVGKLRKPTTGAWFLNMLVRRQSEEVDRLLALGQQMRSAQETLSGEDLRELDRERRQVTAAIARQVKGLGREFGHRVSDTVAEQVQETVRAAMADPTYQPREQTASPRQSWCFRRSPRVSCWWAILGLNQFKRLSTKLVLTCAYSTLTCTYAFQYRWILVVTRGQE